MTNDYIIVVDEAGEPYIAHAAKRPRKSAYGHKSPLFLEKVKLPNGKYRYFYTRKAYEAWLKNQQSPKKEISEKKKRMQIQNLRKTFAIIAKKTGRNSEEAQALLKEIRELEKD